MTRACVWEQAVLCSVNFGGSKMDFAHGVQCGQRPKLNDGGHEARRLEPRQPATVRRSAW